MGWEKTIPGIILCIMNINITVATIDMQIIAHHICRTPLTAHDTCHERRGIIVYPPCAIIFIRWHILDENGYKMKYLSLSLVRKCLSRCWKTTEIIATWYHGKKYGEGDLEAAQRVAPALWRNTPGTNITLPKTTNPSLKYYRVSHFTHVYSSRQEKL